MKNTTAHKNHAGQCTTGKVFTKAQAQAKLIEMGFTFSTDRNEWQRGTEAGRLVWVPDYCNPDDFNNGTSFSLRMPNNGGSITILS